MTTDSTFEAHEFLLSVMRNTRLPLSIRVDAAKALMDRGLGDYAHAQKIQADVEDGIRRFAKWKPREKQRHVGHA